MTPLAEFVAWWIDGAPPHRTEWLDGAGRLIAVGRRLAPGACRLRAIKLVSDGARQGLSTRILAAEDWAAALPLVGLPAILASAAA